MASMRRKELLIQPVPSISAATTLSQQSQEQAVGHKKRHKHASHKANMRDPCTNGGSSARWQMAQRKLTILLVVIVALFLAGQIPQAFAFANIFKVFGEVCACCQPYLIFRAITHTLSLFTYGVNFFVYLILNKHFKNQLKSWISLICPRCVEKHLNVPTKTIITASQTQPVNRSHWLWLRPRLANTSTGALRGDISPNCQQLLSPPEFPSEAVSAPVAFERYRNELSVSDCYFNPRVRLGMRRPVSSHCDHRPDDLEVNYPVRNFYSAPGIKYRSPVNHAYDPMVSAVGADCEQKLQPHVSCFTENFGRKQPQSATTSCTHDSILWKAKDNHNRSEATMELKPTDHSNDLPGQFHSRFFHLSHIYPSIGGSFNPTLCRNQIGDLGDTFRSTSINPRLYSEMNKKPNQESGRSYLSIESCSSFSNAFPPLVYQESDFDVISVDESLETEQKILDTAI
ncbi:hypothetical protein EG68_00034 [Paragonimus skrjabini miyazakii]|uniref:G-protein coupled receptors family 1 profile domain-containing protein n=1 Tax=Paragonimus skrjabini miyazakii TaxID=59628 RepID=A0A8S9Z9S8_9TREM|nr:hypothetical protein EG68_00034 [Paragonimus skrjabini miyazakii]